MTQGPVPRGENERMTDEQRPTEQVAAGPTEANAVAATEADGVQAIAALGRPIDVRVSKLILDNFKSFATKTEVELRDGFTTVSGPNGSGKSNVIDAIQFVLGIATSKGMRAERLTDLICIDSTRPSARVSLELAGTFDKDGELVQKKVEIARVVRRQKGGTAQAHYEVDGTPVRLVDLHDLMRDLGFPTSGQNIVLQGDVIRLTSMGGVARRQVLDELAGTRDFDARIALAHEELQAADRLTDDTKLILDELTGRMGQLKLERDQALAFQTLSGRKKGLEEDLVVLDVQEAEVKVRTKEGEVAQAEKDQKALGRKHEKLEKEAAERHAALEALEKELAEKGDGERLAAVREVEGLRARLDGAKRRATETAEQERALSAKVPQLEKAAREGEDRFAALDKQATDLGRELDETEAQHQTLSRKFEATAATLRRHGADQVRAAEEARAINQELEALRKQEAELSAKDRALAEQVSRRETERTLLGQSGGESAQRREEVAREAAEAAARHRERRESVGKRDERRRQLVQQLNGLRSGLEAVQSRVSRAEQEVARAEERVEQALSLGGGRAMMALKQADFAGLHGSVAELIKYDPKYAVALDTAAAARLFWAVVDDEQVAREGIEHLRRTGAGRLTFAPLSKVRGPRIDKDPPHGRAIVGYAVDLVSADARYEDLLRAVFGDTVVVERLQDALPLVGRYRMVTLEGDLLEKVGTMTGGAPQRGGQFLAAAATASKELDERRATLAELDKQRSAARAALQKAEHEYAQASEELSREQAQLAEAEGLVARCQGELNRLDQALGPQAQRLRALDQELEALKAEQQQVTRALLRVRGDLEVAQGRLNAIDRPDASGEFDVANREAQETEAAMRDLEVVLNGLRQEHGEALVERRSAQERLESARTALTEARAALEALTEAARAARLEADALAVELAEKAAALEALSSELTALARRRDEARAADEKARDAAKEAARELQQLGERLVVLGQELAALRDAAAALRAAAKERGVEVPPVEEAPEDLPRARRRVENLLAKLEAEIAALGPVNQLAIEQYEQVLARQEELTRKITTIEEEKTQLRARIVDLDGRKRTAFLDAYKRVEKAFASTFAELARGEGRLRLENEEDPFAGGLIIEARPRGKKLARLEAMSGGEKSLTALAFIFALQEVNPAPFFVFDEVDQSLDGVNTETLATAIRKRADDRQYLVISHHRVMLDKSNQTIGVTMRKGYGTVVTGVTMQEGKPIEPPAVAAQHAAPAAADAKVTLVAAQHAAPAADAKVTL